MIESKPYFWVVCDRCKVSAQEHSDYSAWGDVSGAEEEAFNNEWVRITVGFPAQQKHGHLCEDCQVEICAVMGVDLSGEQVDEDVAPSSPPCLVCQHPTTPDVVEFDTYGRESWKTSTCTSCGFRTFPPKAPVEPAKSPVSA